MFASARPSNLPSRKPPPTAAAANSNHSAPVAVNRQQQPASSPPPPSTKAHDFSPVIAPLTGDGDIQQHALNGNDSQSAAAPSASAFNNVRTEHYPIYAPSPDLLSKYYHIAKFMSSAMSEATPAHTGASAVSDKRLTRHAKLIRPTPKQFKPLAVIKQQNKAARKKDRAEGKSRASAQDDKDDSEPPPDILKQWRIDDPKRRISFVGRPEASSASHYALLVMQKDPQTKQPKLSYVPVGRFINFRPEEMYSTVTTLEEAEAAMNTVGKARGNRWANRSNTLRRYEQEREFDALAAGETIDREQASANNAAVDYDEQDISKKLAKLQAQRRRAAADVDASTASRKIKRERDIDFAERFSDDEGVAAVDDLVDEPQNSDDDVGQDEEFEEREEERQTAAGKQTAQLLQKAEQNEQVTAAQPPTPEVKQPYDEPMDNEMISDDEDGGDEEADEDDLALSDDDEEMLDSSAPRSAAASSSAAGIARSTNKRPPDERLDSSQKKARLNNEMLTQQDFIGCFRESPTQTIKEIADKLQHLLTNNAHAQENKKRMADLLKTLTHYDVASRLFHLKKPV